MDYPFNLKGILYFPRLSNQFDTLEGQIKLYCNQVFVADNIKEVIPEFLMLKVLLIVQIYPLMYPVVFYKMTATFKRFLHIYPKKVADKLTSLFKNERDNYNQYWDDINPFIKFGCMKDQSFMSE